MSSFNCEHCGAVCSDTDKGYVSGCEHYQPDICPKCYGKVRIERGTVFCDHCGHTERLAPATPVSVPVSPYQPRLGT